MRKAYVVLALVLVWTASTAATCTDDNSTNVFNDIFLGGNNPAGASGGLCPPVGSVRISAIPGSLAVGEEERIDATPRDTFNKPRTDECNEDSGATWKEEDTDVCVVQNRGAFTTTVRGEGEGDCELTVTVDGKTATASFPVTE